VVNWQAIFKYGIKVLLAQVINPNKKNKTPIITMARLLFCLFAAAGMAALAGLLPLLFVSVIVSV
jgi:hypothetical protein